MASKTSQPRSSTPQKKSKSKTGGRTGHSQSPEVVQPWPQLHDEHGSPLQMPATASVYRAAALGLQEPASAPRRAHTVPRRITESTPLRERDRLLHVRKKMDFTDMVDKPMESKVESLPSSATEAVNGEHVRQLQDKESMLEDIIRKQQEIEALERRLLYIQAIRTDVKKTMAVQLPDSPDSTSEDEASDSLPPHLAGTSSSNSGSTTGDASDACESTAEAREKVSQAQEELTAIQDYYLLLAERLQEVMRSTQQLETRRDDLKRLHESQTGALAAAQLDLMRTSTRGSGTNGAAAVAGAREATAVAAPSSSSSLPFPTSSQRPTMASPRKQPKGESHHAGTSPRFMAASQQSPLDHGDDSRDLEVARADAVAHAQYEYYLKTRSEARDPILAQHIREMNIRQSRIKSYREELGGLMKMRDKAEEGSQRQPTRLEATAPGRGLSLVSAAYADESSSDGEEEGEDEEEEEHAEDEEDEGDDDDDADTTNDDDDDEEEEEEEEEEEDEDGEGYSNFMRYVTADDMAQYVQLLDQRERLEKLKKELDNYELERANFGDLHVANGASARLHSDVTLRRLKEEMVQQLDLQKTLEDECAQVIQMKASMISRAAEESGATATVGIAASAAASAGRGDLSLPDQDDEGELSDTGTYTVEVSGCRARRPADCDDDLLWDSGFGKRAQRRSFISDSDDASSDIVGKKRRRSVPSTKQSGPGRDRAAAAASVRPYVLEADEEFAKPSSGFSGVWPSVIFSRGEPSQTSVNSSWAAPSFTVPATSAGITGAGHGSPQRPQQHRQQPAQGQGLDDLQAQLLASVQLSNQLLTEQGLHMAATAAQQQSLPPHMLSSLQMYWASCQQIMLQQQLEDSLQDTGVRVSSSGSSVDASTTSSGLYSQSAPLMMPPMYTATQQLQRSAAAAHAMPTTASSYFPASPSRPSAPVTSSATHSRSSGAGPYIFSGTSSHPSQYVDMRHTMSHSSPSASKVAARSPRAKKGASVRKKTPSATLSPGKDVRDRPVTDLPKMEVGSQSRWLEAAIQDTTFATAAPATALTGSIGVGDGLDDLQLDDWMRDISTSATAAASSQPRQATSGSKASSTEAYALFDALRDSIYSEVATVISLHEHRPHFLLEVFRSLQLMTSDYLRQQTLQLLSNTLSDYLTSTDVHQAEAAIAAAEKVTEERAEGALAGTEREASLDELLAQADNVERFLTHHLKSLSLDPSQDPSMLGNFDYMESVESASSLDTPSEPPFVSDLHVHEAGVREDKDADKESATARSEDSDFDLHSTPSPASPLRNVSGDESNTHAGQVVKDDDDDSSTSQSTQDDNASSSQTAEDGSSEHNVQNTALTTAPSDQQSTDVASMTSGNGCHERTDDSLPAAVSDAGEAEDGDTNSSNLAIDGAGMAETTAGSVINGAAAADCSASSAEAANRCSSTDDVPQSCTGEAVSTTSVDAQSGNSTPSQHGDNAGDDEQGMKSDELCMTSPAADTTTSVDPIVPGNGDGKTTSHDGAEESTGPRSIGQALSELPSGCTELKPPPGLNDGSDSKEPPLPSEE
ncbi:uncharacterized protein LOC135814590 isoform X2 [Sycon ciliatum]|uniref:uncharacterized protein LOC135814590 isoform X2 n=1 Tax=Sycon ciliatum TaxID=27933 RepID=UPI0031F712DE